MLNTRFERPRRLLHSTLFRQADVVAERHHGAGYDQCYGTTEKCKLIVGQLGEELHRGLPHPQESGILSRSTEAMASRDSSVFGRTRGSPSARCPDESGFFGKRASRVTVRGTRRILQPDPPAQFGLEEFR